MVLRTWRHQKLLLFGNQGVGPVFSGGKDWAPARDGSDPEITAQTGSHSWLSRPARTTSPPDPVISFQKRWKWGTSSSVKEGETGTWTPHHLPLQFLPAQVLCAESRPFTFLPHKPHPSSVNQRMKHCLASPWIGDGVLGQRPCTGYGY